MLRSLWGLGFLLLPSFCFAEEIITTCAGWNGIRYTLSKKIQLKQQKHHNLITLVRKPDGRLDVLLQDGAGNPISYLGDHYTAWDIPGTKPNVKLVIFSGVKGTVHYYMFRLDQHRNGVVTKGALLGNLGNSDFSKGIYSDPEPYTEMLHGVCRAPSEETAKRHRGRK